MEDEFAFRIDLVGFEGMDLYFEGEVFEVDFVCEVDGWEGLEERSEDCGGTFGGELDSESSSEIV